MFATGDDVLFSKFAFCLDNSLLLVTLTHLWNIKILHSTPLKEAPLQQSSSDLTNPKQASPGQVAASTGNVLCFLTFMSTEATALICN